VSQERSVLAILRALMPRRTLRFVEAERIAELQANRFLGLAGVTDPPVPSELITELPRIRVVTRIGLPVSGMAQWLGGQWLLTVAGHEPATRQRFSLAHEFKHVLDHPYRTLIYRDHDGFSAHDSAERLADHFAACLLMPKKYVVRAWGLGIQQLPVLSALFEVSPQAMQTRLFHLGLILPTRRCHRQLYQRHAHPPRRLTVSSGATS
jgi:hypothetical protein